MSKVFKDLFTGRAVITEIVEQPTEELHIPYTQMRVDSETLPESVRESLYGDRALSIGEGSLSDVVDASIFGEDVKVIGSNPEGTDATHQEITGPEVEVYIDKRLLARHKLSGIPGDFEGEVSLWPVWCEEAGISPKTSNEDVDLNIEFNDFSFAAAVSIRNEGGAFDKFKSLRSGYVELNTKCPPGHIFKTNLSDKLIAPTLNVGTNDKKRIAFNALATLSVHEITLRPVLKCPFVSFSIPARVTYRGKK